MPNRDAVVMSGMMWPVSVTVISEGERRLLRHGATFVKNNEVAPVLATVCAGSTIIPRAWCWLSERGAVVFDVTTVMSLSSGKAAADNMFLVGYSDLR